MSANEQDPRRSCGSSGTARPSGAATAGTPGHRPAADARGRGCRADAGDRLPGRVRPGPGQPGSARGTPRRWPGSRTPRSSRPGGVGYGGYEGLTTATIRESRPAGRSGPTRRPAARRRAGPERLDRVIERVGRSPTGVFAHGHALRVLAARWLGLPAQDGRLFRLDTATSRGSATSAGPVILAGTPDRTRLPLTGATPSRGGPVPLSAGCPRCTSAVPHVTGRPLHRSRRIHPVAARTRPRLLRLVRRPPRHGRRPPDLPALADEPRLVDHRLRVVATTGSGPR